MSEISPLKSPVDLVPSVDSTRSFLETLLENIDGGDRLGLSQRNVDVMRRELSTRLELLDNGPQSGVQEKVSEQSGFVAIPSSNRRGKGTFPEILFSRETGAILDRIFPSESWDGPHRASISVLAVLIDESVKNGDTGVDIQLIAERTGYRVSTVRTEFGVLRNMKNMKISAERGTGKYRVLDLV